LIKSFKPDKRKFKFFKDDGLDPINTSKHKKYTITVCGHTGTNEAGKDCADFKLKVKNPCFDPAYVTISTPSIPDWTYNLFHDSIEQKFYDIEEETVTTWRGDPTLPFPHDYCGDVVYKNYFNGVTFPMTANIPEANGSQVIQMVMSPIPRVVLLLQEDIWLVGTQDMIFETSFANY
jgi:hypothetical protein